MKIGHSFIKSTNFSNVNSLQGNSNFGSALAIAENDNQQRQHNVRSERTSPNNENIQQSNTNSNDAQSSNDNVTNEINSNEDVAQNYTSVNEDTASNEDYYITYEEEKLQEDSYLQSDNTSEKEDDEHIQQVYAPYYNVIITDVAQVLQLPPQELEQVVNENEILVKDLDKPNYIQKIVQYAYDISDSSELLEIEDIVKVYSEIASAVTLAYEKSTNSLNDELSNITEKTLNSNVLTNEVTTTQEVYQPQEENMYYEESDQQQAFSYDKGNKDGQLSSKQNTYDENVAEQVVVDMTSQNISKTNLTSSISTNTPISQPHIMEQVKGQIKLIQNGMLSEMAIKLTPENLGEINLRIATINGIVVAQFVAESQKVKEILEQNMGDLAKEMEDKGIQVSELSVSVKQENGDQLESFLKEQEKSALRVSQIIKNIMEEPTEEQLQKEQQLLNAEGATISHSI